jgi:hypothetical protein
MGRSWWRSENKIIGETRGWILCSASAENPAVSPYFPEAILEYSNYGVVVRSIIYQIYCPYPALQAMTEYVVVLIYLL